MTHYIKAHPVKFVAKLALIILALMLITNVGYNSFKRQYVKDQIPIQLSSGRKFFL